MASKPLTVSAHHARSAHHVLVARRLVGDEDDWAAVCFFYSAFHLVKAALIDDPVFQDPIRLQTFHVDLQCDDRFANSHHGRRTPNRVWGVNELVMLLYRDVVQEYERLHQASISARYLAGFKGPVQRCADDWQKLSEAAASNALRAS